MEANTSESILQPLNQRQRQAVTSQEGPVLVIAGPGSGKTRALAHRIAYLIASGLRPQEILAVTFTNKAAEEMQERVNKLISVQADKLSPPNRPGLPAYPPIRLSASSSPFIGTFHGFAAFVLRKESARIGYRPHFTIFDEDDTLALIKEVMKELNLSSKNFPAPMVASVISNLKNDLIAWDEYEGRGSSEPFPRTIAAIYKAYQERLKVSNALDFDDLIFHTVRLWRERPAVLNRWQSRYRYLNVDEYQDTNASQYELVKMLAQKHHNLFVIGDDAQSIYGWRGADYKNILNFERDWPEAKVILLEENYRSTPEILEAANHLIRKNQDQKQKTLWTKNPSGRLPEIRAHEDERAESEYIAEEIAMLRQNAYTWKDFAVLYRTNAQSRVLEEAMLERDVPYAIIGGIRFFQRREIKDLVAYLRLLQNPGDALALKRIINVPARGIGPKTFLSYLAG
ncbi:MAG: UvrD-helicase domain-containing protein, partial [Patescibacteria group bacterium]